METHIWRSIAIAMLVLAGVAMLAERRRNNRSNPDSVGFMPWTMILTVSLVVAAFAGGLALRGL